MPLDSGIHGILTSTTSCAQWRGFGGPLHDTQGDMEYAVTMPTGHLVVCLYALLNRAVVFTS